MSWDELAMCRRPDVDVNLFFEEIDVEGNRVEFDPAPALRICAACAVRAQCLDACIADERTTSDGYLIGVFGGTTASERVTMRHSTDRRSEIPA
jgi:hypothetical protein